MIIETTHRLFLEEALRLTLCLKRLVEISGNYEQKELLETAPFFLRLLSPETRTALRILATVEQK